jgi:lipid-A-disaccharide synthase
MKYYFIAGEASGDLHGSNLLKELTALDPDGKFRGFGGDNMANAGLDVVVHYKSIAFMGLVEVVMNLGTIMKAIKTAKQDILAFKPDVLILIDYPGFNLKMAKFAKEQGIKVVYYISPKIWAWKEGRIDAIKKYVDKMICIFPFEKEFYAKWNYRVDYVGNPLVEAIGTYKPAVDFIAKHNLNEKPIIAVLPGSRVQEIQKILPVMVMAQQDFPDYQFVIAATSNFTTDFYKTLAGTDDLKLVFNETYDLLSYAKAGIITSGTATLETALFGVPQVVCYRTNYLSYHIGKRIVKIKYFSLVDLILDKAAVKELLQGEMTRENISDEIRKILEDVTYRNKILSDYTKLKELLGEEKASKKAAEIVYGFVTSN